MSLSVNEFWNRLTECELAQASQCRQWAVAYAKKNDGKPPTDVAALSRFLIAGGALTRHQAKSVLAGRGDSLRRGSFRVLEPATAPWRNWEWAKAGPERPPVLIRAIEPGLTDIERRWLAAHQAIDVPTLQPLEIERDASETWVVSPLPPGQTLAQRLVAGPCDETLTVKIGIAVASALSALHAAELPHGQIHPQRVWIGDDQSVWLLRDPAIGPADPFGQHAKWLEPPEQPAMYAAPEFTIPGQVADALTDQYALGCLLLHARNGRPPFVTGSTDELLLQHTQQIPQAVRESLQADAGEPLLRVIAHAMAKNADARFADLRSLRETLLHLQRADTAPLPASGPPLSTPKPPPAPEPARPPAASEPVKPPAEKPAPTEKPARETAVAPPKLPPAVPAATSTTPTPTPVPVPSYAAANEADESTAPAPKAAAPKPAAPKASEPEAPSPKTATPEIPTPEIPTPATPAQEPAASASPVATADSSAPTNGRKRHPATADGDTEERPKKRRPGGGSRKKKKKKSLRGPLVIGGLGFAAMMLLVIVLGSQGQKKREVVQAPVITTPYQRTQAEPPAKSQRNLSDTAIEPLPGFDVSDDASALWLPPSADEPPRLEMIPRGPQMVLVLRPKQLLESTAGQQFLAAFDKEIGDVWQQLEARTGVPPDAMERLTVAFDSRGDGIPTVALGVQLASPVALSTLRAKWDVETARTPGGATILAGDGEDAFFVSDTADEALVERFAVGSIEQIKDVAEIEGGPIPLPRQLENLWKSATASSDVNLLLLPNYLFADGRTLLQQHAPEVIEPLRTFLQPDASGVLLKTTLDHQWYEGDPQWYVELRVMPGPGTTAAAVARKMEASVAGLPAWAENFLIQSSPDASWRALALRYPQMLYTLKKFARYGISGDAATTNIYLPAEAAPNIGLATLLAANTPRGGARPAMVVAPSAVQDPLTLTQMLELPLSVSFEQESLEFAGQAVMDELKSKLPEGSAEPKYVLLGGDLQKEGITQNQQIRDFKATDMPLREILTQLVMRANIDKSVTSATQPEQLLVWVVAPNPNSPSEEAFLVTTRAGAAGKYELPKEFVE